MSGFTESYLAELSAALTAEIIKGLSGKLREKISGTPKEQAIERCICIGLTALVATAQTGSKDERQHLETIFIRFFQDEKVGREIGVLLRGKKLNRKKLAALFADAGFEAGTLPGFDFDRALAAFAAAFQLAATDEPELQGTIKTNQALTQTHLQREILKTLRGLVEFLQKSRLNSIRIKDGEVSAQPQSGKKRTVYHLNLNKQIVFQDGNFRDSNVFTSENTKIIKAETYIEKIEKQPVTDQNTNESRNIEIPFVIFAMTENEASNLISGQVFSNELATQGDLPRS